MRNAGAYNHRIKIIKIVKTPDKDGFMVESRSVVLEPYAKIKTTSGYTLIKSGTDFEQATTNFTIRYPQTVTITRDMQIEYAGRQYEIQYLNNVNEASEELEIQAKAVTL